MCCKRGGGAFVTSQTRVCASDVCNGLQNGRKRRRAAVCNGLRKRVCIFGVRVLGWRHRPRRLRRGLAPFATVCEKECIWRSSLQSKPFARSLAVCGLAVCDVHKRRLRPRRLQRFAFATHLGWQLELRAGPGLLLPTTKKKTGV